MAKRIGERKKEKIRQWSQMKRFEEDSNLDANHFFSLIPLFHELADICDLAISSVEKSSHCY